MTQYIDKNALVAKIDNLKHMVGDQYSYCSGWKDALLMTKAELNTLEVKEVDLKKEIEEYFKGWTDDYDNGGAACHYQYVQVNDCKAIAKHFFELGLKTQKGE